MAEENARYNKGADGRPITLEPQDEQDGRRYSPSVSRNRDVVRDTFKVNMTCAGDILEIGSGTGEHGVHISAAMPNLRWTFTDRDLPSLESAKAWMTHSGRAKLDRALVLDASAQDWGAEIERVAYSGMFCANVIHISPFAVAEGLFAGAARVLSDDGRIFLYGPFAREGAIVQSNAQFDLDLKRRNPAWGVRDLEREIIPLAQANGFALVSLTEMPRNNLAVVFARA